MDETFNPALALTRSDTFTSLPSASKTPTTGLKQPKSSSSNYPRLELEPLYTDLKDAVGARWDSYSDALTRFVRGTLHAREFADLTDEIIYGSDQVLHLHNKFVCAIAFNSARDNPEPGIAVWVTAAADKSTTTAATKAAVTSDAGEQRLKKEVMALHSRDRKRLKGTLEDKKAGEEEAQYIKRNEYEEAYAASKYKVPEVPQASIAGGLTTKTNLEPEIKKRYQQSLFAESSEFPDATSVYARMVPICYEEAIPQGATMACAELAAIGAEFYFKELLLTVFERVRADGPRYDNGVGGGVFTTKFLKQVQKEEELVKIKKAFRTKEDDILPYEAVVSKERRPLGVTDFMLAGRIGAPLWTRTPLLGFDIEQRVADGEYDDWKAEHEGARRSTNGHVATDDEMDIDSDRDDDDFDWEAEGFGGRDELDSLMDNCLTVNAP